MYVFHVQLVWRMNLTSDTNKHTAQGRDLLLTVQGASESQAPPSACKLQLCFESRGSNETISPGSCGATGRIRLTSTHFTKGAVTRPRRLRRGEKSEESSRRVISGRLRQVFPSFQRKMHRSYRPEDRRVSDLRRLQRLLHLHLLPCFLLPLLLFHHHLLLHLL